MDSIRDSSANDKFAWGNAEDEQRQDEDEAGEVEEVKANFGLSGALAKDERTGNMRNGVLLQYTEALDAAAPDRRWRLYVFKGADVLEVLHLHRQSAYLLGRDERVADIVVQHPSCSKQHAVIQFRMIRKKVAATGRFVETVKPYVMDLKSANKTLLNGVEVEDARYYELIEGDVLKFGGSTRDYVILNEDSASKEDSEA